MIKYYCDRCGEEMDGLLMFVIDVQPPTLRASSDKIYPNNYQLCRGCLNDVDKFIATKQTDCPWKRGE